MQIKGKALKLGDNINTDFIISGRFKFSITDIKKLARHIMEDIDPYFKDKVIPGQTIIVAGKNFGLGSSREQAPLVIKEAGIIAVIAKSFARIFYRNSFNIGLPLIETNTDDIVEGDSLEINLDTSILNNAAKAKEVRFTPLPKIMQELIKEGGVVNYFKKHEGFPNV